MDVRQAVPAVGSGAATPRASASALPTQDIGDWVIDLSAVVATDAATVGGKAANLGELLGAGFPVPPGFVLPASSYQHAMEAAGVRGELDELHGQALAAPTIPPPWPSCVPGWPS